MSFYKKMLISIGLALVYGFINVQLKSDGENQVSTIFFWVLMAALVAIWWKNKSSPKDDV